MGVLTSSIDSNLLSTVAVLLERGSGRELPMLVLLLEEGK